MTVTARVERSWAAVGLVVALAAASPAFATQPELAIARPTGVLAEEIRTEKARLEDASEKYDKVKQRVVVLTGQYEELEKERQGNTQLQERLEGELTGVRNKTLAVAADLARLSADLEQANAQFAQAFADFAKRLTALYEMRSYPLVGFVFRAQSFTEFQRRAEYARVLSAADLKKMEELAALRGQIESKSKALAVEKAKMEQLKDEKRRKNSSLAQAINKGQEILDKLRIERVSALSRAQQLSKYTRELTDRVKQLEHRRVAQLAEGPTGAAGASAEAPPDGRAIRPGTLGWPLDGDMEVVRPFGKTKSPNEPDYVNPGVDIRIVGLKTVKAVEAGKVIHQGRLPSFGTVLMIDHGGKADKIISVYGNLDSIMVGVGQWVRRGDPVALIGQGTGSGAETQLHLEIRKNAEPSDPLVWLER